MNSEYQFNICNQYEKYDCFSNGEIVCLEIRIYLAHRKCIQTFITNVVVTATNDKLP